MTTDRLATLGRALGHAYTLERELGGGGMSRVFLAREVGLNREVVIKVLPDDVAAGVSFDRFNREIQLAASLSQANIVPLLTAGSADGVPYFTMPFVQGESLRTRLGVAPALTVAECVGILRDVARALSYAHARGVVHRDIKPDNVLLSHGTAVVTDFGIAKALSASRTHDGSATLPQADSQLTRAIALDSTLASLIMRTFDAQVFMYERNYAAADSVANAVLSLDSTFLLARSVRGEALLGLGRIPEAIRMLEQLVNAIPAAPATEYHGILAYVYARAGDTTRARAMLDRIRASSGGQLPPMGVLAATLEQLGKTDEALAVLIRARDQHDPWLPGYIASERYDRLRKDPRGAAIVATVLAR